MGQRPWSAVGSRGGPPAARRAEVLEPLHTGGMAWSSPQRISHAIGPETGLALLRPRVARVAGGRPHERRATPERAAAGVTTSSPVSGRWPDSGHLSGFRTKAGQPRVGDRLVARGTAVAVVRGIQPRLYLENEHGEHRPHAH